MYDGNISSNSSSEISIFFVLAFKFFIELMI